MNAVLGIKCGPQHDTGAAVVYENKGQLACVAISEERLSRDKQCRMFPERSIKACLHGAGLRLEDIDLVCLDKLGPDTHTLDHRSINSIPTSIWQEPESDFLKSLGDTPVMIVNHHMAHAATAFCVHDMDDAACLVIDGTGSDYPLSESPHRLIEMSSPQSDESIPLKYYERRAETQSIIKGTRSAKGQIHLTRKSVSTRSGCGHFYSFFTRQALAFGHLQEGKSMGLAAWGDPSIAARLPEIPNDAFQGIDTLMLDYLKEIEFQYSKRPQHVPATDKQYAAFAYWMQATLKQAVIHLARLSLEQCDSRNLCMAGGVALNVVNNRFVLDTLGSEQLLDRMFVQPASSDSGMPLGAALYGYYIIGNGTLPFQKNLVYLGPPLNQLDSEALMLENGAFRSSQLSKDVADLLLEGKIVGWLQGRSEYGPRALGARSILCWPRPKDMKDHLNLRIKHREPFRPFAPIISETRMNEVFDVDFPVPYMLFNTQIRSEFLDRIPAVAHVDGSGRLQTVSSQRTPQLHDLLDEIQRRDQVGVLLNTSFNDAGEPIVETAADAIDCYHRTGLDALVVGDTILVRGKEVKPSNIGNH